MNQPTVLRDLTEEAASEILKDQRVISYYIRNCALRKGIHCRAGDPSPWKLCPWLPAAETEGATWEPCLACGWFPKSQCGNSKMVIHLDATCWHCCSSENKGCAAALSWSAWNSNPSETPSHPLGISTLCLPHLYPDKAWAGRGRGHGGGGMSPAAQQELNGSSRIMVPHPSTAASFCMATEPGHPTETLISS